jgi:signal peptidase I
MKKEKTKREQVNYFKRKFVFLNHPEHFFNKQFTIGHFILSVLVFILVVWTIANIFTTTRVDGDSMYPTLHNEELLLIRKYLPFERPARGDIISSLLDETHNNSDGKTTVVKRVIALPGEIVEFKNRRFSIINPDYGYIKFKEDYLIDAQLTPSWDGKMVRFYVPEDEYFVLGDNREISEDSRDYGTILENNIIGKIVAKIPSVYIIEDYIYDMQMKSLNQVVSEMMFDAAPDNNELNQIESGQDIDDFINQVTVKFEEDDVSSLSDTYTENS